MVASTPLGTYRNKDISPDDYDCGDYDGDNLLSDSATETGTGNNIDRAFPFSFFCNMVILILCYKL